MIAQLDPLLCAGADGARAEYAFAARRRIAERALSGAQGAHAAALHDHSAAARQLGELRRRHAAQRAKMDLEAAKAETLVAARREALAAAAACADRAKADAVRYAAA